MNAAAFYGAEQCQIWDDRANLVMQYADGVNRIYVPGKPASACPGRAPVLMPVPGTPLVHPEPLVLARGAAAE